MPKNKKILLLSPFPPSQNPRLLKEYTTLKSAGYNVCVIYGEKDKWSSDLINKNDKNFTRVGGKHSSAFHSVTRVIHKLLKLIAPIEWHYNRVNWLLYVKARNIKADLYIGHNLAALPIIAKLAKLHHTKYGFDAEDFHRQVDDDDLNGASYKRAKYLEDKYLTNVSYMTAASPLIAEQYAFLYPSIDPIVINNVFSNPFPRQPVHRNRRSPLKLFWFSQTIGKDRGIQTVLQALGMLKHKNISLTLLGSISPHNKHFIKKTAQQNQLADEQLIFLNPVEPNEIFQIANNFDIGMALEPAFCLNNNLALSNKLFTYIASGLAVLATETAAQKQFFNKHPSIGKTFLIGDHKQLAELLNLYYENPSLVNKTKANSRSLAVIDLNWENESQKFLNLIDDTLKH